MSSPDPSHNSTSFPHQAAKASWVCAVIVFLLLAFGGRTGAKAVLELVALLIIVVGLVLGFAALFGIPKHGTKGILAPALVGIIINGLLIFIFVTNFMAARAKAQGMRSDSNPFHEICGSLPEAQGADLILAQPTRAGNSHDTDPKA